jgi:hypothetical protein
MLPKTGMGLGPGANLIHDERLLIARKSDATRTIQVDRIHAGGNAHMAEEMNERDPGRLGQLYIASSLQLRYSTNGPTQRALIKSALTLPFIERRQK